MNVDEIDARLAELEDEMVAIIGRVDDSSRHLDVLDTKLDRIHGDLLELIELWRSAKGFVKIVKWTGTTVKWLVGIGAAIGLAWAALTKGIKL